MSREWKPGGASVAVISWVSPSKRHGGTMLAFRVSDEYDESHWHTETFGVVPDDQVTEVRPLVVIDPEDAEQVDRLVALMCSTFSSRESAQAALREFATPTPPRPDEPQGLGAVVEDYDGNHWVKVDTAMACDSWTQADAGMAGSGTWVKFEHLHALRVLSEGVS